MKRFIFALLMGVILFGSSGCKDKGKERRIKLIEEERYADLVLEWFGTEYGGLFGKYDENPNDPNARVYYISVNSKKKEIDCWMEDPTELAVDPHYPIKWHKYEIDKTNRTISIYRQRRKGLELVVKVKFVGDKEFKIVGYGDWLSYDAESPRREITPEMDEKTKEELVKEAEFNSRFIPDTNRIYSME